MGADLAGMIAEMQQASALVRPSAFWEELNDLGLHQLERSGMPEFKRTLNSNYFQWLPTSMKDEQVRAVARRWLASPTPRVFSARLCHDAAVDSRIGNPFTDTQARIVYAVFVAMLWEECRRRDRASASDRLSEPSFGHPLGVRYRGKTISQDLGNSALEFLTITESIGWPGGSGVIELGGGYGRLAWVFLKSVPDLRYCLVDIPPALAVAEEYLTSVLPGVPAFRFRRFTDFEAVRAEFDAARLVFLTPNQLDIMPPLGAGLFVNVSSLHEMRPEQIGHYFQKIAQHAEAGYFYTKQWSHWRNPSDEVVISHDDYPVPSSWATVFDRPHMVQTQFFEALYQVVAGV